jgi:hypothetical protein
MPNQKVTIDMWDRDPNDKKLTIYCLPSFKFDLPVENFPEVKHLKGQCHNQTAGNGP